MKHLWAFLIKFTAIGVVLFSLFGIFNTASLTAIFFITLTLTIVAYFIGDLYTLPKFGNWIAAIADFGLAFVVIWFFSVALFEGSEGILWMSFIAALTISVIEVLFHIYIKNHVLSDSAASFVPGVYREDKLATEFSDELTQKDLKERASKQEEKRSSDK